MKIDYIEIKDFRIFSDTKIKLGKKITCISGYNGLGKSTILAILSNVGELKKEIGTHINGKNFRGEFSEIIRGDRTYDTSGEKCSVHFIELPTDPITQFVPKLSFRSTFQKTTRNKFTRKKRNVIIEGEEKEVITLEKESTDIHRYRFIPIKNNDRDTESKIPWPTYYLGLSRLYPIGESENAQSKKNIPPEIMSELMQEHKAILSSNQNYIESSSIIISDAKKKSGFGIKTDNYSELMNSSGQDNLGQILLSVYSFQILKQKMGTEYTGGLLLIDEIDATFHPVAQNNLIDFLYRKANELDLQIVFTTHSLSLLNHVIKHQETASSKDDISLVYLYNKRGLLETIEDPSINFINNDLMDTYSGAQPSRSVPVFTEDDTGRWFLQKILQFNTATKHLDLNFINMYTNWNGIIKLMKNDYAYFKNYIVTLDPDISQSDNLSQLRNSLIGTRFSLDRKHTNILILPGDTFIEKMMWDFAENLEPNSKFFYDATIEDAALNKTSLISQGPFSSNYISYSNEKTKIKKWFESNKWMMDTLFYYWVNVPDNQRIVAEFFNKLQEAYNPIYHQRR